MRRLACRQAAGMVEVSTAGPGLLLEGRPRTGQPPAAKKSGQNGGQYSSRGQLVVRLPAQAGPLQRQKTEERRGRMMCTACYAGWPPAAKKSERKEGQTNSRGWLLWRLPAQAGCSQGAGKKSRRGRWKRHDRRLWRLPAQAGCFQRG